MVFDVAEVPLMGFLFQICLSKSSWSTFVQGAYAIIRYVSVVNFQENYRARKSLRVHTMFDDAPAGDFIPSNTPPVVPAEFFTLRVLTYAY